MKEKGDPRPEGCVEIRGKTDCSKVAAAEDGRAPVFGQHALASVATVLRKNFPE